jgi:hypothetical protein
MPQQQRLSIPDVDFHKALTTNRQEPAELSPAVGNWRVNTAKAISLQGQPSCGSSRGQPLEPV